MSLRYWYRDNDGTITEFTDRVNINPDGGHPLALEEVAEQGDTGSGTITVDDPDGTFDINGERLIYVTSTEIAETNKTIWFGYVGRRTYRRMEPWSGAARQIEIEVRDVNKDFDRRIAIGPNWQRPAETVAERLAFMLGEPEMDGIFEDISTYVDASTSTDMDKDDLRGRSVHDILADMSRHSGDNFYAFNVDTGDANGGSAVYGRTLWFGPDSSEDYASAIRLTNDPDDWDGQDETWIVYTESEMERNPERVHSLLYVIYDTSRAWVSRADTAAAYARIERSESVPGIKTVATAKAYANRQLEDHSTEEDVITVKVKVHESKVNMLRAGHRVQCKFLHFPDYADDYRWMRVMRRTMHQLPPDHMEIEYVLGAPGPAAPATPEAYAVLWYPHGPSKTENLIYYDGTGDDPPRGFPPRPKSSLIDYLTDSTPPNKNWPDYGFEILGDGTVDVVYEASTAGVRTRSKSYTIQTTLRVNGDVVAASSVGVPADGSGLTYYKGRVSLEATGVTVANGDHLTVHTVITPAMAFFRTPAGVGGLSDRFEITGGTLA